MKNKYNYLVLILLIGLHACEPVVTFNQPQPSQTSNLKKIPTSLKGNYQSLENGSVLAIQDSLLIRMDEFDYKFHKNELDSHLYIHTDTLINRNTLEKTLVNVEGDSITKHISSIDTLFALTKDNVIRKYKGYYFLNVKVGDESWYVNKLQKNKRELIISRIASKTDIENLKEIAEPIQDTLSPYHFKVNKKKFKEFVKKEGFSTKETFVEIK